MKRKIFVLAVLSLLLNACSAEKSPESRPSFSAPEKTTQNESLKASVLSPFFEENTAGKTPDEIRAAMNAALQKKSVPFGLFAEAYQYFPHLEADQNPLVNLTSYHFITAEKTVVLKGVTRESAFNPRSDIKVFADSLRELLPDFSFEIQEKSLADLKSTSRIVQFEIVGSYQNKSPAEPSLELSETEKFQLARAIPENRDEGPFLQSIADLSKNKGLSLQWIKENLPPDDSDTLYRRFQVTVAQEGFIEDLLDFLTALPRLTRKPFLVGSSIERTDLRSGVEIGKGQFTLEIYFLE